MENLSNAAIGLWVKSGSWCSKHETDGVIPASRVKALKGTPSQIRALIECGLWVETRSDLGAKCYSFRSWLDYQPSREEREEERAVWREKKRKSRRQKLDNQRNRQNVPGGVPGMSTEGTFEGVTEMSGTIPVPSRPDPTNIGGTGSQPTYGDQGDGQVAGSLTLDGLADATRRARQAGISESAIATGTRKFNARPNPKGPGLLRTLINDAWETEQTTHTNAEAKTQRRAAIDACTQCDDLGYVKVANGTVAKCTHQPMKGPF